MVFFLFFMTGLAIVIYLNQTPMQPRERDYAYAGSFYAFAIWCGIGVAAVIDMLCQSFKKLSPTAIAALVSLVCLLVPVQMASQTWDDHDRSGRYTCRDFGQNYLMSLQQEGTPIIYTNGDNDTFPLWYNQDVEGVRTDARVCNLSYLQTDWYIDQMRRPAYDSPSVPISWERIEYCAGTNEYVTIEPDMKEAVLAHYKENPEQAREQFGDDPFELKNILKYWVRDERTKEQKDMQRDYLNWAFTAMNVPETYRLKESLNIIPTDTVYLNIDKEAVLRSGMMLQGDSIPDRMAISLADLGAVDKSKLMMLELLANANWERPLYVAMTVGQDNYMNLGNHFVQEGLAYRITPFTTNNGGKTISGVRNFDTSRTYDNIMHRFKFGGIDKKGLYIDETVMRMCFTHRRIMSRLALELISEGKDKQAEEVLAYATKMVPSYNVPHNYSSGSIDLARAWATIGKNKEALDIMNQMWTTASQYLRWYCTLDGYRFESAQNDCAIQLYIMQQLLALGDTFDQKWSDSHMQQLNQLATLYEQRGGSLGY